MARRGLHEQGSGRQSCRPPAQPLHAALNLALDTCPDVAAVAPLQPPPQQAIERHKAGAEGEPAEGGDDEGDAASQ